LSCTLTAVLTPVESCGVIINNTAVSNTDAANTASAILTVVCPPTITKSFSDATITVGDSTTLTFQIINPNPDQMTNVLFSDILPTGLTLVQPIASNPCDLPVLLNGNTIELQDATLAGNQTCNFAVTVMATASGTVTNTTTTITGTVLKLNVSGGTASASIDILPLSAPNIIVTQSGPPTVCPQDRCARYIITIANIGTGTGTIVTFTDRLPRSSRVASFKQLSGPAFGIRTPFGQSVSATSVAPFASGSSASFVLVAQLCLRPCDSLWPLINVVQASSAPAEAGANASNTVNSFCTSIRGRVPLPLHPLR
jgi:uncharacterized repeat protein (TIGR01451 family)